MINAEAATTTRSHPSAEQGVATRRFWVLLLVVCAVALILRVVALNDYIRNNPFAAYPIADAETYWLWADRIAHGQLVGDVPYFSAPLYPYVLGLLRALGADLADVYVCQLLVNLLTGVLLAWIARERFGPAAALLAAALFFSLTEPLTYTVRILSCTLQLLVLCILWLQLIRTRDHPSLPNWLLAGALCGLFALCFAPAVLLLIGLCVWAWLRSHSLNRRLLAVTLTLLAGLAAIFPALLHNYLVTGELHNIQASAYINMAQGYGPGAYGVYTPRPELTTDRTDLFQSAAWAFRQRHGREGTWREINAYYRDQVLKDISEAPGQAALLALKKAILFFTARDYDDIIPPRLEADQGKLNRLYFAPLPTPWLMGAAIVGLLSLGHSRNRLAIEWALLLLPLLVVVLFMYTPRYRIPVLPILCAAAAALLVMVLRTRRPQDWGLLIIALAATLGGELLRTATGLDAIHGGQSQATTQLAIALERTGRRDEAITVMQDLCLQEPDNGTAHLVLADLLTRAGEHDEAIEAYRFALRLQPGEPRAHTNLGLLLNMRARTEDLQEALVHFRTPAAVPRQAAKNHHGAGMVLEKLGRKDEALVEYRQAVSIDPANWRAQSDLANLLAAQGAGSESISHYRQAIRHNPRLIDAYHRLAIALTHQRRDAEAVAVLRQGLAAAPEDRRLMGALAWLLATTEDPQVLNVREAIQLAERAALLAPDDPALLEALAQAYAADNQYENAIATIRKAIELADPENRTAMEERLGGWLEAQPNAHRAEP
ncbi:MAG: tetratricopeptide repeat protein [Phycisphaerales bacterium]|nr:MAG: tetratricopeptide repeat protein [Phycisphaerales bacterium]